MHETGRLFSTAAAIILATQVLIGQDANPPKSRDEAVSSEFKCPTGAHDSGNGPIPGTVVRWCDVQQNGRPVYHGPVWRWYESGKLEGKEYYLNGDAAGMWPSYYENGQMSSLGSWENGSKTGTWKYWNDDGGLSTEVRYSRDGNSRTDYYADGTKKATGTFVGSGKIGKWTYWGADGKEKARCDFGRGVLKLPDKSCELIAKELDPEGYSFPIPVARKEVGRHLSIFVESAQINFTVPSGWLADTEAGRAEDLPVVFYPTGKAWRSGAPNMYIRVAFKEGRSFEDVVKSDSEQFKDDVGDYKESQTHAGRLQNRREYVLKSISYKPVMATDSPFSIVASNQIHEQIAYLDSHDEFVLLLVLTAEKEQDIRQSADALAELLRSSN